MGFLVIDELLNRHKDSITTKLKILKGQIEIAECVIENQLVVLGIPHTFVNLSGKALKLLTRKYNVSDYSKLIIIHDELDFMPGKVKSKFGGGSAGHKGIDSISMVLKSKDFWRVRVGIGKPPSTNEGANYVLGKIQEGETLDGIKKAADTIEDFLSDIYKESV